MKKFEVPENIMAQIVNVINNLPYGQIAPLANELTKLIVEQSGKTELNLNTNQEDD